MASQFWPVSVDQGGELESGYGGAGSVVAAAGDRVEVGLDAREEVERVGVLRALGEQLLEGCDGACEVRPGFRVAASAAEDDSEVGVELGVFEGGFEVGGVVVDEGFGGLQGGVEEVDGGGVVAEGGEDFSLIAVGDGEEIKVEGLGWVGLEHLLEGVGCVDDRLEILTIGGVGETGAFLRRCARGLFRG